MSPSVRSRAPGRRRRAPFARVAPLAAGLATLALAAAPLAAQHDYYNTDAGRPLLTEDATAIEYRGFELQAAPLRLERATGGRYRWGIEPELAWGVLPRTQLEVGIPLAFLDADAPTLTSSGMAGIDVSVLHQLNVESPSLPAFALSAGALLPVGALAPDDTYATVKAIATRTFAWGRLHLNGARTFGPAPALDVDGPAGPAAQELARWAAGVAVDHTFPIRATLVGAELVARQPLADGEALAWQAGVGARRQLSPRWAVDAGIERRLTGDDQGWSLTFGTAYAFGIPRTRF